MSHHDDPMTRRQHDEDIEDVRMDFGVSLEKARGDWRRELNDKLTGFKNEIRVLLIGLLVILKFHLPPSITFGAVALVAVKAAWTAFIR